MPDKSGWENVDRIENKLIYNWYYNNVNFGDLDMRIRNSEEREGYVLDTKSGLLIKKLFSDEVTENLGQTILKIKFPRPVDYHYHKDVAETFYVERGEGVFYSQDRNLYSEIAPGKSFHVPKNTRHSFMPKKKGVLEMLIVCSGVLDPAKEVCVKRFDEFWQNYDKEHSR